MRNFATYLVCLTAIMLIASCSGSSAPAEPIVVEELPDLNYDLITDPGSTVSAADVSGELQSLDDAINARIPSALPTGYQGIQGMYFTPATPPGGGFSGRMTLQIAMDNPTANEYDGVRLFLFYIHPTTLEPISLDSARANGNWVSFDVNALGHFVIAESLSIPRPDTVFTVSAFADLAITTTGTNINFWAIAQNGVEPYTYSWDFNDGATGSGIQTAHAYPAVGTYTVTVTATDASGDTTTAASTPIDVSSTAVPLTNVVVSMTRDADNYLGYTYGATISGGVAPYTYSWDFDGDGNEDSTDTSPVNYAFATHGVYNGTLDVTDSIGDSVQGIFTTTVVLPAPVITSIDPPTGVIGEDIRINGEFFDVENTADGVWIGAVQQQIVTWTNNFIIFTIAPDTVDDALYVRKDEDSNSLQMNIIPRSPNQPGGGQI